jgi:DNA-binding XRE family transcriptional regulator
VSLPLERGFCERVILPGLSHSFFTIPSTTLLAPIPLAPLTATRAVCAAHFVLAVAPRPSTNLWWLEVTMKNLKKLRTMVGRGQYWLAEETGIERSRLSLIENGRVSVNEREKAAIEKALLVAMRENVAQFTRLSGTAI